MNAIYFRTFETADQAIAVACGSQSLRAKFAALLGFEDAGLGETSLESPAWETHYEALRREVEAIVRREPAETWIARLNDAGIPVAAVRFPVELFDDPQAHANGMFHDMAHPTAGAMRVVGPPVALDGDGFQASPPTPSLGSETDRILMDLGFDADAIEGLVAEGIVRRDVFAAAD
jgi:crotonobetainyl-CoA:carnitine CoA-transferase CaiB-like acyl-CoA transferase